MNLNLKQLNRCDYYVLIWCLYQMQGFLYPEGPIGQALQALLIVWAGFEGKDYLLPNRRNPPLLKAMSILLFMYCCYGIPLILFNPGNITAPHVYLQEFLNSFLPVYLFYKYLKEGYLTEDKLGVYIWFFLVVTIWHYFKDYNGRVAAAAARGRVLKETTNNIGYEFLALMPMSFFFYKRPIIQFSLLCTILLFVVMGMKRGAIGIGLICFIWALYINIKTSESRKQRYIAILGGLLIVLLGIGYTSYQLANSEFMAKRIEDTKNGNSSDRDVIYTKAIDLVVDDTSIQNLLIGHGARGTLRVMGKLAHQDWLETAVNNGFLGICILLYFCFVFLQTVKSKSGHIPKQIQVAFLVLYFIFISRSMFSMSLGSIPCFLSMIMSFCIYYKENGRSIE